MEKPDGFIQREPDNLALPGSKEDRRRGMSEVWLTEDDRLNRCVARFADLMRRVWLTQ